PADGAGARVGQRDVRTGRRDAQRGGPGDDDRQREPHPRRGRRRTPYPEHPRADDGREPQYDRVGGPRATHGTTGHPASVAPGPAAIGRTAVSLASRCGFTAAIRPRASAVRRNASHRASAARLAAQPPRPSGAAVTELARSPSNTATPVTAPPSVSEGEP